MEQERDQQTDIASVEFAPIWRLFVRTIISVLLIWAVVFAGLFSISLRGACQSVALPLFVLTVISMVYFRVVKLRCPKCKEAVLPIPPIFPPGIARGRSFRFCVAGRCHGCGARLKDRWISEDKIPALRNALLLIVLLLFVLGLAAAVMTGGIAITRTQAN
jgi:hypothetical protein